jgi:hypothetical protein
MVLFDERGGFAAGQVKRASRFWTNKTDHTTEVLGSAEAAHRGWPAGLWTLDNSGLGG